jgi:hypothetical protein
MTVRNWLVVSLLGLAAPLLFAQQGRVGGPVAGYVFDSGARALRPVLGIPGSSLLGDPVGLGITPSSATVSPRLDSVIAVADDGSFHAFALNAGVASEITVNGIAAAPARVAYSPSGSSAALYSGNRIQIVTGLPGSPVAGSSFDISTLLSLPGGGHHALTGAFAVSDDGSSLLVADANAVTAFGAGGTRQIAAGHNSAIAFAPGSHDAAIAGTTVMLVKDVAGAAARQSIASDDTASAGVGVAFSADGAKLFVASSAGVGAFDLAAGTRSQVKCDCTPAGLTGMGNVYRLNEVSSAPLWLFDPAAGSPRIVFVPAKSSL